MENKAWEKAFEEAAHAIIEESGVPGVIIGLNQAGESVYRKDFGYRDKERQLEITPHTVMGIASITKSFTCAAIMQLQEAGELSVHDPVLAYLPEFHTPDRQKTEKMTIHHFMTHTSGLPFLPTDYLAIKYSMGGDIQSEDHPIHKQIKKEDQKWITSYEDFMEIISKTDFELLGPPGEQFSYSNDAYSLLGAIIERVSGKPYDLYVHDHILAPAGMVDSTFSTDYQQFKEAATIYHFREKDGSPEIYPDPQWEEGPVVLASGHLNSTLHDMLRYTEIYRTGGMVGNERILSSDSVKQMTTTHVKVGYDQYYGYGLFVTPNYYGATLIEHSGGIKGVASQMAIIPERGITGDALGNLAGAPVIKLVNSAVNCLEGRSANASSTTYHNDYSISQEELRSFTGTYQATLDHGATVTIEEGTLMISQAGQQLPLQPIGEDYFLIKAGDDEQIIKFNRDGGGKVKSLSISVLYLVKVSD